MKNKRIFEVYVLRRPDKKDLYDYSLNQPLYFGKGKKSRKYEHRKEVKYYFKHPELHRDIKSKIIIKLWNASLDYTEETYINNLTEEEAFTLEKIMIARYGRINNNTGCLANLTDGGEGPSGFVFSEETKKKLSILQSGENNGFHGKHHSDESKKKISESRKGKYPSSETRKKLSKVRKGVPKTEEHKEKIRIANTGKTASKEARKKMSESHKGVPLSEQHKQSVRDNFPDRWGENNPNWGTHWSEERKQVQSERMSGENHPMHGKTHTEEAKKKMSQAHKGRKHTDEHKRKIQETKAKKRKERLEIKLREEENKK